MNRLLKSLILWLMLLALPLQGYASATMLMCTPLPSVAMDHAQSSPAPEHDHAAMLAEAGAHHAAEQAGQGDHEGGSCNLCAACCVGAAMLPSTASALPNAAPSSETIPFAPAAITPVDLDVPERPPTSPFA